MNHLRISAVSYLNTFPFVFGIRNSGFLTHYDLQLDVPSICAEKIKRGDVDIALVPAGALPGLGNYTIVADYCIGAIKDVKTVLLLSQEPLEKILKIYLDFDSRTSVELVRVLARRYWRIDPAFEKLKPGEAVRLDPAEAVVAIGDKTFAMRPHYRYVYDLASEWILFTSLPFVFAVWVSRNPLPESVAGPFKKALAYGVSHIDETLGHFKERLPAGVDCKEYLEDNISYTLDADKRNGLDLFLKYL